MSAYGGYYTMSADPVPSGNWDTYTWIVACGGLAAFFMAWGIGANDVANSFATSVGSKTLTLWQAVIVAGVFEFVGAIGLGGETTKTIASDIANVNLFVTVPEIYMYGMLCSLAIAGTWLLVATYFLLPVSTTHSIIGAVMGFSIAFAGADGILWSAPRGDFPYVKGFLPVVLSWFFSPIMGGILSAIIFNVNRFFILRRKNSTILAIWTLPLLLFVTLFINIMFVLAKGAKSFMEKTWPCVTQTGGYKGLSYSNCSALNNASAWIAAVAAAFVGITVGGAGIWWLRKRYLAALAKEESEAKTIEDAEVEAAAIGKDGEDAASALHKIAHLSITDKEALKKEREKHNAKLAFPKMPEDANLLQRSLFYVTFLPIAFWVQIRRGLFFDIFVNADWDEETTRLHNAAEVFNPHTERVYMALQVVSACCVSFAHGSNDVANAIGPFSAILTVFQTYAVPTSNTATPAWMFVLGGFGLVVGLMMYGYNIIMQLGIKMLHLTPTRGFSAELAAGLTISLASFYGIPVSTTQIIVGCEVGVALSENTPGGGLGWKVFISTFLGWIWTILLSLVFAAALFSMGAYAPSVQQSAQLNNYRLTILQAQNVMLNQTNTNNILYKPTNAWWSGTVAPPMLYNGDKLNSTIVAQQKAIGSLISPKKWVDPNEVLYYLAQTTALVYQNYSITAVGQNDAPAVVSGAVPYAPKPAAAASAGR